MKNVMKFFRIFVLALAVAVAGTSCKDGVMEDLTSPTTTSVALTEQQKAAEAAAALLKNQGKLTEFNANATAGIACDGVLTFQKSHLPIRYINTKILSNPDVIKNISGGRLLKGVLETAPAVPTGEDVKASGKFWEKFDCPKYAIFPTLVWTVDPAQSGATYASYYAGYAPTATHTVVLILLVTKEDVFLQCHEIDDINGVKSYDFAFSEVFAYETGSGTGVVTPPTTGTGNGTGPVVANSDPYVQLTATQFILNEGAMVQVGGVIQNDTPADDQPTRDDSYTRVRTSFREKFGPMLGLGDISGVGYGSAYELLGYIAFKADVQAVLAGLPTTIGANGWTKLPANSYGDIYEIKSGDKTFRLYVSAGKMGFKKGAKVYPADHRLVSLAQWKGTAAGNDPGVNGAGQTAIVIPF